MVGRRECSGGGISFLPDIVHRMQAPYAFLSEVWELMVVAEGSCLDTWPESRA